MMSRAPMRAALAVFLLGALGVWLIKPIGDPCPDVGRLPAGSQSSSSPSLAPPLTRTCTYTTADGTEARKRYVPVVDWLVLAVVAGVVAAGAGLAGPGPERPQRAPEPTRAPRPGRARRAGRAPEPARPGRGASRARGAPPAPDQAPEPEPVAQSAEERAAARERERQERARRRERR